MMPYDFAVLRIKSVLNAVIPVAKEHVLRASMRQFPEKTHSVLGRVAGVSEQYQQQVPIVFPVQDWPREVHLPRTFVVLTSASFV